MSHNTSATFMNRAIELSLKKMLDDEGGPFGAVVVKDNQIISEGWNSITSQCDPTAHAEIEAIRKACKHLNAFSLKGCSIYTSCEPCPMCISAIYWSELDKVYYANTRQDAAKINFDDSFIYTEIALDISKRKIPMEQTHHKQAQKVFQTWELKSNTN